MRLGLNWSSVLIGHDDYDHYTSQQRAFVNSIIRTTHRLLEEYRLSNRCNMYGYLSPTHYRN